MSSSLRRGLAVPVAVSLVLGLTSSGQAFAHAHLTSSAPSAFSTPRETERPWRKASQPPPNAANPKPPSAIEVGA